MPRENGHNKSDVMRVSIHTKTIYYYTVKIILTDKCKLFETGILEKLLG